MASAFERQALSGMEPRADQRPGVAASTSDRDEIVPRRSPLRAVANCTADWESWHGPDGRLIWVNPAVERMTGYSVAECLSMPEYPLPIVVPEDRGDRLDPTTRRREAPRSGVDFRAQHRGGSVRWFSLSRQPMREIDGRWLGFRTSIRDVTERSQLREELRLHAEHLEQLVQERTEKLRCSSSSSGRWRSWRRSGNWRRGWRMRSIIPWRGCGNAELIRGSTPPDHEHYELLELIDREIERIGRIAHQMYQLYGRLSAPAGGVLLGRVVSEVVTMLESVARRGGVSIEYSGRTDGPPVLPSRGR